MKNLGLCILNCDIAADGSRATISVLSVYHAFIVWHKESSNFSFESMF